MQTKHLEDMTTEEKRNIIRENGGDIEHLLAILLELQRVSPQSFIDDATADLVADEVGLSHTKTRDILTYYAMLETKPCGRYVLEICNSAPCFYSKSEEIACLLQETLGIGMGETTADGMFSLRYTPCVGACDIGPVIKVKDEIYGNLTPEKVVALTKELRAGK